MYEVFQDSQGFIWFGTDNGAVKFDGHELTVFGTAEGLEDPVVFGIMEDHRGRIWFRTYSGRIFYYENGKIISNKHNKLLVKACSNGLMSSMFVDTKDQLWFSAGKILGRIDAQDHFLLDSIPSCHLYYKTIESGHLLGKYVPHVSNDYNNQLTGFDIDGNTFPVSVSVYKFQTQVNRSVVWHNKLYLSNNNLIFEYDGTGIKKVFTGSAPIICLSKDNDDNLWVGYHNTGAERYSTAEFENPWRPPFLQKKSVSQILSDNEGGLWATTLESGVFYIPDPALEFFPRTDSSKITSVLAADEKVIFGTYDGTVSMLDAETKKVVHKKSFESARIIALFKDSRKNIWISAGYLSLLDINFKETIKLKGSGVHDFAEDRNGDIWAGSSTVLFKYDGHGKILAAKLCEGRFRNMLFADSVIYMTERLGLHVFDQNMNFISAPPSLAKFKISKLISLNDSLLLAATIGNGFLVVNKHTWRYDKFDAHEGSVSNNIYTAAKKDTALWLGTEKGILITSVNALIKRDPNFTQITTGNGLKECKINFLVFNEKSAWAFSDNGISVIKYTSLSAKKKSSAFYYKNIFINKKEVFLGKPLSLPQEKTDIIFTFGYRSLKNQDVTFRYRLTKNDQWIYTLERRLQFSSLASGDYELEIEHSTDNLHWTRVHPSFTFSVMPPWWQRWYVQALAILAIGSLIYLYFRNHYRIIHEHQEKLILAEFETLERERSRIAKELHDGVATNLGAIKLMVSHLLRSHKEPLAEELDEHFLYTIKEIKGIIYGLTPPGLEREGLFTGLKNYIGKLNQTIPIKIHLDVSGKDIRKPELGLLSFRIIQELLSNSVRHSKANNISIKLKSNQELMELIFWDDGIGFSYDPLKNGLGLANVESRVESVRGKLKFASDSNGTSFTISLPLN